MQRQFFGRGIGRLLLQGEAQHGNRGRFRDQREHTETAGETNLQAYTRPRGSASSTALALARAAECAAALLHGERHTRRAIHFEREGAHAFLAVYGGACTPR